MQKLKYKKKILYALLGLSIGVNILVLCIDTVPYLIHRAEQQELNNKSDRVRVEKKDIEQQVVTRAMEMVNSPKVTMVWDDPSGFTKTIASKISKHRHDDFKTYNYPRAFLYYGLAEYYKSSNDQEGLDKLKEKFDVLIKNDGQPAFVLDKVDQVPFGQTAMSLYAVYKENKYKVFYEHLYEYLKTNINEDGIILYRGGATNQLNDVLGMVVPFLADYYKLTNDSTALKIAKDQVNFFIEHGVDRKTGIPSHGVSLSHLTKTGSANWGRGIGWYLLGLSALNNITNDYEDEFIKGCTSLNLLKLENDLYSQYPGSSRIFDASTSVLFLYGFNFTEKFKIAKEDFLELFAPYIEEDGSINGTSGDTYGLNNYSQSFGKSELTQGIFLLLIANSQ